MGAHPDDETFVGGTIAKHTNHGHKATIVSATRGGRGHWKMPSEELERVRTEEMQRAAAILGADVVFLNYKDAEIPGEDCLTMDLVDVVRRLKPDVVVTFHPLVWRDDHRRVGQATADACFRASLPLVETRYPYHRPAPQVYFIGEPFVYSFSETIIPLESDVYIDISEYMDVKIEALKQHRSQWIRWEIDEGDGTLPLDNVIERTIHRARQLGIESGVKYAEAFVSQARRKRAIDFLPAK
jgi:LmbE family N-acetylglucosaminyl deacetylase